jgi:hypothetical protein
MRLEFLPQANWLYAIFCARTVVVMPAVLIPNINNVPATILKTTVLILVTRL